MKDLELTLDILSTLKDWRNFILFNVDFVKNVRLSKNNMFINCIVNIGECTVDNVQLQPTALLNLFKINNGQCKIENSVWYSYE